MPTPQFVSVLVVSATFRYMYALDPVVERVDSAIHHINNYQMNECWQNKLQVHVHVCYPLNSDLSG